MITLKRQEDCSGCTACKSICPKDCISMVSDREGFVYPVTDTSACINCNACNRVCPVLNVSEKKRTQFSDETKAFASYIEDRNILLSSSSGGIFSALAKKVIDCRGIVYGAAWDNDIVKHIRVKSGDELQLLRGSKYAQSSIGNVFKEIKSELKDHIGVLFSGTPCQVAGLKSYLGRDYENLILIEVACHGAPSPLALKNYIEELQTIYGSEVKLNFRAKPDGEWRDYKITAYQGNTHYFYENQKENIFMKGFLRELYSRPICHECPFKAGISGADITLADFWGIENVLPNFPSKNGVSLVLTHNLKGETMFRDLTNIHYQKVSLADAVTHNGALLYSEQPHPERGYFFRQLGKIPFSTHVNKCLSLRTTTKLKLSLKGYLNKIFG